MYKQGDKIESMCELQRYLDDGNLYVYVPVWKNKVKHIGFIISMQYRIVENFVKQGRFYRAIKSEGV